jgi:hypothetical protein
VAPPPRRPEQRPLGVDDGLRPRRLAARQAQLGRRRGREAAPLAGELDRELVEAVERPGRDPEPDQHRPRLRPGPRHASRRIQLDLDLALVMAEGAQRRLEPRHVVERAATDHELARRRLARHRLRPRGPGQQGPQLGRQVAPNSTV